MSQGWEPLCAFLGKPVPNTPFPHVNDTKQFNQYHLQKLIRVKKVVQAAKVRWRNRSAQRALDALWTHVFVRWMEPLCDAALPPWTDSLHARRWWCQQ